MIQELLNVFQLSLSQKFQFLKNKLREFHCLLGQIPGFQWNLRPLPSLCYSEDGDSYFLRNIRSFFISSWQSICRLQ